MYAYRGGASSTVEDGRTQVYLTMQLIFQPRRRESTCIHHVIIKCILLESQTKKAPLHAPQSCCPNDACVRKPSNLRLKPSHPTGWLYREARPFLRRRRLRDKCTENVYTMLCACRVIVCFQTLTFEMFRTLLQKLFRG